MRTAIDRVPVRKLVCDECLKAFCRHLRLSATVRDRNTIKPWQLYRTNVDGKLQEKLAEAATREELWKIHERRPDYNYAIVHSQGETDAEQQRRGQNKSLNRRRR